MLGKEAALFVASGTQSNLVGDHEPLRPRRRIHRRPDGAHLPLRRRRRGGARQRPAAAARAPGRRLAGAGRRSRRRSSPTTRTSRRSRLLCLENTIGGKVLPLDYLARRDRAGARGAAWRPTSTARACSTPRSRSAAMPRQRRARWRRRSTASRSASRKASARRSARRWSARASSSPRRIAGARWSAAACARPASLAAAALHALDHHVERLADDHALARAACRRPARACPG